jgi:hypothetical protein
VILPEEKRLLAKVVSAKCPSSWHHLPSKKIKNWTVQRCCWRNPASDFSGFINTQVFLKRVKRFAQFVKPNEDDPVLIISDGHIYNYSLYAVILCRIPFITLLSLPLCTSHIMQPLPNFFGGGVLKTAFATETERWM